VSLDERHLIVNPDMFAIFIFDRGKKTYHSQVVEWERVFVPIILSID
jgi:hypothetical protein